MPEGLWLLVFDAKQPKESPMPNRTTEQLNFGRLGRRHLQANFEGGDLSSDGGLMLLRQIDARTGLSRLAAKALTERRAAGRIRHRLPIAVTSSKRISQFPTLPTVAESLKKEYEIVTWYGIDGPPGLPQDITEKVSEAVKQALADPSFSSRLDSIGADRRHMGPKEYAEFVDAETKKWKSLNLRKQ